MHMTMTWSKPFSMALMLVFSCSGITAPRASAQAAATTQPEVVLVKLSPLVYPPLARQARISGDVKTQLHIRADGSVAAEELISGHPMLAPAAIENAKKSEFECRGCTGETEYGLTYTFGFVDDPKYFSKIEDRRVRAAKCLYLWKCSVVQVNTVDFCSASHLPPQISQTPGHVKILAFPVCVQAESSAMASR
jgi:hypothetical protein